MFSIISSSSPSSFIISTINEVLNIFFSIKEITLFDTRQYIDLEGYVESTLENNTTFCEVLKSEFIQHRILAISLYILFRKVFIIVTSYNIYFLSSTYLLQNQIDLDWRALRPPICNQTCV